MTGTNQSSNPESQKFSVAQTLLKLASNIDLFHTPEGDAYATFERNGHSETWPIGCQTFHDWLHMNYYRQSGKPPGGQAFSDALGTLNAKARLESEEREIFLRIAEFDGNIYLDLANKEWEVVEITPQGWRIIPGVQAPVSFIRKQGMYSLSHPVNGGTIDELRQFVNVYERDFFLLLAWLVGAGLHPNGPYPVLILQGEPGAAKSTTTRVLRELVDPHATTLRALPRNVDELFIAARNNRMLAFDNLSGLTPKISDVLCQLATGGGFAKRQLYSDNEEILYQLQRAMILNGIDDIATRYDLMDRALILHLPIIPKNKRQDESYFWMQFKEARPRILGALLTALSKSLHHMPYITLSEKPRLADFATRGCALERALDWPEGKFISEYKRQRDEAVTIGLESNLIAQAIHSLIEQNGTWEGTCTDLLMQLEKYISPQMSSIRAWPKSPQILSRELRRLTPAFRDAGTNIDFCRVGKNGSRMVCLCKSEKT